MLKKLLISLIARGRPEYTLKTIASLNASFTGYLVDFSVWHNGPISPEMEECLRLADNKYNVRIHRSTVDIGWGAAHNANLAQFNLDDYEYVLLTDNDVVYNLGWFEHLSALLEKYPNIGVLAAWKHTSHGLLGEQFPDLVVKDQMPGCGWMFKSARLKQLLPMPERGAYQGKGGVGEDVHFCNLARVNHNLFIAGPVEDVATHIDGY